MQKKMTAGLLAIFAPLLLIGAGCSQVTTGDLTVPANGQATHGEQAANEETAAVTILRYDRTTATYVPQDEDWRDNGCLVFEGVCFVKDPNGSDLYVPEGVDFFGDGATDESDAQKTWNEAFGGNQNRYEDEFLSFRYPEDMRILKSENGDGWAATTLEWIALSKNGNDFERISSNGFRIHYPYWLKGGGYDTWEDFMEGKLNTPTATPLTVGGQEAVLIDSDGKCEHYYELYVRGPSDSKTVYNLSANCVSEEEWNAIYGTFAYSVEFKK
ncbi:hypothetical protein JW899_04685 [Candidatus Uhrbacteria bacterium]|nr:hypothetical protein [Candidatus Uhrbacteria bacterium]